MKNGLRLILRLNQSGKYSQLIMWFALSRDGELLAVASSERCLWGRIKRKLGGKEIDVVIGYSQTAEERKTACFLL